VMSHGPASPLRLSQGEQRALASFYAGRLPAGQLHAALTEAREAALTAAVAAVQMSAAESSPIVPESTPAVSSSPALRAA
jgi:hypothetical protein